MNEPQEVTDRRWRFNLMGAVERIADSTELRDLHDTELIDEFFGCVSDDCSAHGAGAMTVEECAAAGELCKAIKEVLEKAPRIKRGRVGRVVMKPLEPEDLVALGWFDKVQPLARDTFNVFMRRGWLSEGLWAPDS